MAVLTYVTGPVLLRVGNSVSLVVISHNYPVCRYSYSCCFTNTEVWEAQRGEVTYPGSHSIWGAELGMVPSQSVSQGCARHSNTEW